MRPRPKQAKRLGRLVLCPRPVGRSPNGIPPKGGTEPPRPSERPRHPLEKPSGTLGARLQTASRPPANGVRASTRTYPITAHRKCRRSLPPRVAWHLPPLLPSEKEARGSYKKPGEPLTALSLQAEAKGLVPQRRRDPAIRTRTHGPGKHHKNPSLEREKSPWRSEITPPGPWGLHPAGALARTLRQFSFGEIKKHPPGGSARIT